MIKMEVVACRSMTLSRLKYAEYTRDKKSAAWFLKTPFLGHALPYFHIQEALDQLQDV